MRYTTPKQSGDAVMANFSNNHNSTTGTATVATTSARTQHRQRRFPGVIEHRLSRVPGGGATRGAESSTTNTSHHRQAKPSSLAVAARGYEHLYKLLFIGDSGVGKTCLIWRLCDGTFNKAFIHTIGK